MWSVNLLRAAFQRSHNPFRRKRNPAKADTGGVEDGVRDGTSGHGERTFAGAGLGLVPPVDQHRLHNWKRLAEIKDGISLPVKGSYLPLLPGHLFAQRPAHALERTAFHLVAEAVGI